MSDPFNPWRKGKDPDTVLKALDGIKADIKPGGKLVTTVVGDAADIIRDRIKREAPLGPTGNLRRSIYARMRDGGKFAEVGVEYSIAPHAHMVEYGTSRGQTPNPFFRRGAGFSEIPAISMMLDKMAEGIDEHW